MPLEGGKSVRESLQEVMDSRSSAADAAPPSPAPASPPEPAPSPEPSQAPAPQTTSQDSPSPAGADPTGQGRVRGPDGKFVAKPDAAAPQAPPADGQAKPLTDSTVKPKDAAPDTGAPILPPHGWGKDAADWNALPRTVQAKIETREKDRDRALSQERNKLQVAQQRYGQLEQVLGPRRQSLIAQGGEAAVLAQLFQLSDYAAAAPESFLQWFAKQRGIDLGKLVAGAPEPAAVDPVIQSLQSELAQTKQALIQVGNHIKTSQQSTEAATQAAWVKFVDDWGSEADPANGEAKRPYFDRLKSWINSVMPQVIESNPGRPHAELLQIAYDSAVRAHPETWEAVNRQNEAKRQAEEIKRQTDAAAKARLAGASISGSTIPSAGMAVTRGESVGATLRRVAAGMGRTAA